QLKRTTVAQSDYAGGLQVELTRLRGLLQASVEKTDHGLNTAILNNPSRTLGTALRNRLEAYLAAAQSLLGRTPPGTDVGAAPDLSDHTLALQASFELWDQAAADLDRLIHARVNGYTGWARSVMILVFVSLML